MQVAFRPLAAGDLAVLRAWFSDAELARRVAFPTDEWFAYVAGEHSRCWVALDQVGAVIGEVQVDREEADVGYIELVVRPDLRGKGVGRAILAAFVAGPGGDYTLLEARTAPDNHASLGCLRRCGFEVLPQPDSDGLVRAVRRMAR